MSFSGDSSALMITLDAFSGAMIAILNLYHYKSLDQSSLLTSGTFLNVSDTGLPPFIEYSTRIYPALRCYLYKMAGY